MTWLTSLSCALLCSASPFCMSENCFVRQACHPVLTTSWPSWPCVQTHLSGAVSVVSVVSCLRLGLGLLVFQQPLDELVGTIHISVAGNGLRCVSREQKRVGRKPTN